jgi:NitT/TauT family transport system ATP-binding protein
VSSGAPAPATPDIALRAEAVSKVFGTGPDATVALDGVDLDIRAGEFVTVVGASGCGKSTLLNLFAGLDAPTSGVIWTADKPALMFQEATLLPWLTAQRNVELALKLHGVPRAERRERARELLRVVRLEGWEDKRPHELSGGMKQRVAIARSLAYDPEVLLMDEPFAALDAQTRETLQGELLRIWRATGKTIVFITHGIDEAVVLGQRVAVMTSRPGRIKQVIDIPEVLRSEAEDVRALPEFGEVRHEVWSLLREEVQKAQQLAGGVAARRLEREVKEVAHV